MAGRQPAIALPVSHRAIAAAQHRRLPVLEALLFDQLFVDFDTETWRIADRIVCTFEPRLPRLRSEQAETFAV